MRDPLLRAILVGGDHQQYQLLSEQMQAIESSRCRLMWCLRHEHAQAEILSGQYDLVLLDAYTKSQQAFDFLRASQREGASLPVVALADQKLGEEAIALGALDFLTREELQPSVLERCLRYALERNEVNRRLSQINLYDPLTGIPSRQLFRQMLEKEVAAAGAQQSRLALLVINLDGFKKINEGFGHDAGDCLVSTMATRLTHCVRRNDRVARIGGDEFSLILDDCARTEDITLVARKVIEVLSAPCNLEGSSLMISCSVGSAVFPDDAQGADDLLKHASMAMQAAKQQRGSQYLRYSDQVSEDVHYHSAMEADMRRALRNNEFELFYQPRVDMESGDMLGMEALIRWRHPERGMVSPKDFIPVAEESGLILPIGYWIIHQACEDMKRFDAAHEARLDIAVNISFKQLQDTLFVDTATRIIQMSGIDASRLEFELTETTVMSNYEQTYESMMALSRLGITFSLDDFGTGFSSFAHIQRLPISALKIDRSFVRNVVQHQEDAIIVKAIINLAHSLGLKIIAEGVETFEQVQLLWHNKCDQVQGYYFSPAVSAEDFAVMVMQRAAAAV